VWALQRRCEQVAAELGLPGPFTLAQLIKAIEKSAAVR
jgi:hypothetical protein